MNLLDKNVYKFFLCFEIITKFPHEFESSLDEKINTYLKQLAVNHLHAILFHSFDSYVKHRSELNGKIKYKYLEKHYDYWKKILIKRKLYGNKFVEWS
jgi:hypothetical protein